MCESKRDKNLSNHRVFGIFCSTQIVQFRKCQFYVPTNLQGCRVLYHLGFDSVEYKRKSPVMVVYTSGFFLSLSPLPSLPPGNFAGSQLRAGVQEHDGAGYLGYFFPYQSYELFLFFMAQDGPSPLLPSYPSQRSVQRRMGERGKSLPFSFKTFQKHHSS